MRNKLLAGAMALALVGCGEKPADDASVSTANAPAAAETASDAAGPDVARLLQAFEREWVAEGFPDGPAFDRIVDGVLATG